MSAFRGVTVASAWCEVFVSIEGFKTIWILILREVKRGNFYGCKEVMSLFTPLKIEGSLCFVS